MSPGSSATCWRRTRTRSRVRSAAGVERRREHVPRLDETVGERLPEQRLGAARVARSRVAPSTEREAGLRALARSRRRAHGCLELLERRVGPGDDGRGRSVSTAGGGRLRGRERRHARPAIELREGRLLRRGGRLGLLLALGEGEEARRVLQARRAQRRVGRRERHGAGPAQIEQRPGERDAIRRRPRPSAARSRAAARRARARRAGDRR